MFSFLHRHAATALVALFAAVAPFASTAWSETVLKFVPDGDLKILDPIWTTGNITRDHGYMVYDTLFALDANFKPQPQMVDHYTVTSDGLVYTFVLRDGLKWHDLTPVRAADCVASLKRWGARDTVGQKLLEYVASMEAVDETTFTITLSKPYSFVINSLARISNTPFMMREKDAMTDPYEQITEVVGSGPFKFVASEWVPGGKVVYEKFKEYVPRNEPPSLAAGGKVVKVDKVEWYYMPDANTAVAALNNGEVDWYHVPPPDLLPLLEQNPDVTVTALDPVGYVGVLRPNHLQPPFNNVKARQALMWATDQSVYMKVVAGNEEYWDVCPSFFTCGTPFEGKGPDDVLVKPNLEKAAALLKASGYTGEPIVVLDPTDQPYVHNMALVTAQNLRNIGATVKLRSMDWSTMLQARAEKGPPSENGWNIFHTWSLGVDYAIPLLNTALRSTGNSAWFGWPNDPEIEKLKSDWLASTTAEEQKERADLIQARAFEFVPYVPLGRFVSPTAYRKNISGIIKSPVIFMWNVEKH